MAPIDASSTATDIYSIAPLSCEVVSPGLRGCSDFFSGVDHYRLEDTFSRLREIDVDPPAPAVAAFARAIELRREARRELREGDASFARRLLDGRILLKREVRCEELTREMAGAYHAARDAVAGSSVEIVEALRGVLAGVLDRVADASSRKLIDPAAAGDYEAVHSIAHRLRWATGEIAPSLGDETWWRFANPDRVHADLVAAAEEMLSRRPAPRDLKVRCVPRGTVVNAKGQRIHLESLSGFRPSLEMIAERRDEWQPTVLTAPEVFKNVARVADELGISEIFAWMDPEAVLGPGASAAATETVRLSGVLAKNELQLATTSAP